MNHTNLRQQLQDQLTKAGYSSIKIMPSSFYIQAKDKKGEPVAMVIGPDSFAEVTEILQRDGGGAPTRKAASRHAAQDRNSEDRASRYDALRDHRHSAHCRRQAATCGGARPRSIAASHSGAVASPA